MSITSPTSELLFLGARCRILSDAASTGGRYSLVEFIEVPPGDMPPLHVHRDTDEGFLLLDGELTLFLPGREIPVRRHELVVGPRGVPHSYRVGDAPARFLVFSFPAGFEDFVRDVAALPEATPDVLGQTAAAHAIDILGPPGMLP